MLQSSFFLKRSMLWWSYIAPIGGRTHCRACLVRPSRCHLLQTSARNLLALRPGGAGPSDPRRGPQSHRGGHEPHEGVPDRTPRPDHSEGALVVSAGTSLKLLCLTTKMAIRRLLGSLPDEKHLLLSFNVSPLDLPG